MDTATRKGFSFGLTSGIITTLGLIVGLNSSTHSEKTIIGTILLIAIANSLSDSLGMYMAGESAKNKRKNILKSANATFLSTFLFVLTFIVPFIFFPLNSAIIFCIIWGLGLLTALTYNIARREKVSVPKAIIIHLGIAILVILITHLLGILIRLHL